MEWFKDVVPRQLTVIRLILQEWALLSAEKLSVQSFKASNRWLDSFRNQHNISFAIQSCESTVVIEATVDKWKEKLSTLTRSYNSKSVYNMNETGLFLEPPMTKLYFIRERNAVVVKRQLQLSVMLCVNMLGEKEKALVIWKYKNPRCFKNIRHKNKLPIHYYANKKVSMASSLFEDWVRKLDRKMIYQRRKILLFMDNVTSHSILPFKNVRLCYFPVNTTSKLQPMNQGIIQASKTKYQKMQIQKMVTAMDKDKSIVASNMRNQCLQAIYWFKKVWDDVKEEIFQKCF